MKLFLASGNAHKAAELQSLADASASSLEIVSARAVGGIPAVAEDTGTFIGNARKKALALRSRLADDAWVLADDSGLCVDELDGAPGVESAYYAGPQGDGAANLAKLVAVMRTHPLGRNAAIIGRVVAEHPGMVTMRSLIGGERVVTLLSGEQLPRIC